MSAHQSPSTDFGSSHDDSLYGIMLNVQCTLLVKVCDTMVAGAHKDKGRVSALDAQAGKPYTNYVQ